jgi:hypothetical protein
MQALHDVDSPSGAAAGMEIARLDSSSDIDNLTDVSPAPTTKKKRSTNKAKKEKADAAEARDALTVGNVKDQARVVFNTTVFDVLKSESSPSCMFKKEFLTEFAWRFGHHLVGLGGMPLRNKYHSMLLRLAKRAGAKNSLSIPMKLVDPREVLRSVQLQAVLSRFNPEALAAYCGFVLICCIFVMVLLLRVGRIFYRRLNLFFFAR